MSDKVFVDSLPFNISSSSSVNSSSSKDFWKSFCYSYHKTSGFPWWLDSLEGVSTWCNSLPGWTWSYTSPFAGCEEVTIKYGSNILSLALLKLQLAHFSLGGYDLNWVQITCGSTAPCGSISHLHLVFLSQQTACIVLRNYECCLFLKLFFNNFRTIDELTSVSTSPFCTVVYLFFW